MIHLICPNPAVDRTLLLDGFHKNIPNRPIEVRDFAGGKGFNVAYALGRGGASLAYVVHTILGGENGDRMQALAEQAHIPIKSVLIKENTRECNILVDVNEGNILPVYEKGFELNERILIKFTDQLVSNINPSDIVVFSGSLMEGMPNDYINIIQKKVNDSSVKFIVDTSGSALKKVVKNGSPYLIKINDEEYNELFNTNLKSKYDFLNHMQVSLNSFDHFIVTLGGEGIVAKFDNEFYLIEGPTLVPKNPVASGDFLLGGLIKGIEEDLGFEETIIRAVAYATDNVTHWYPHVELKNLDKLKQKIKVTKL